MDGWIDQLSILSMKPLQMGAGHSSAIESGFALQVKYNILDTSPEKSGLLDKCNQLGVSLVAHSPLQQGALTGDTSSASHGMIVTSALLAHDPRS